MAIRILLSAAINVALLSICCQGVTIAHPGIPLIRTPSPVVEEVPTPITIPSTGLPEARCFDKDVTCCYKYKKCAMVETKVPKTYACPKKILSCRKLPGVHTKHCESKTVQGTCYGYELRAYPKYCPHWHCPDEVSKLVDIVGGKGALVKTEDFDHNNKLIV